MIFGNSGITIVAFDYEYNQYHLIYYDHIQSTTKILYEFSVEKFLPSEAYGAFLVKHYENGHLLSKLN